MPDQISRLQLVQQENDKTFGSNYARENPQLVTAVLIAASSDWAASRLAVAIERVAEALLVEEEERIVSAARSCGRGRDRRYERTPLHSNTSSARPSNGSGTVMPSALAALRLRNISTFVPCWTGSSPGFSPLRMRPV
jgi:hypothetical protein